MADNEWNLYDAAQDHITLDYQFENEGAQQLFNLFNDTTPKLLKLYERREFLTYFFMGYHSVPQLTAKQAMDFKLTFGMSNFPANGLESYIKWRDGLLNDYADTFPYLSIQEKNFAQRMNHWKVARLTDIDGVINGLFLDNYNEWETKLSETNIGWESATELLVAGKGIYQVQNALSILAGLFASGKFVVYYDRYIRPAIERIANGTPIEFDPYTGTLTIGSPDRIIYNGPFDGLLINNSYRNPLTDALLIIPPDGTDKTLSYPHRFFCILCQWISQAFDKSATAKEYKGNVISSYWDFSPIYVKNKRPSNVIVPKHYPKLITDSRLLEYIKTLGATFMRQTQTLDTGEISYKDYWDGAQLVANGHVINCPFYYVIHIDFDSIDERKNPFKGSQLTAINERIAEIMAYRDSLLNYITTTFKNVTVNKSCTNVITNMSTAIFEEGSTNNNVIVSASCTLESGVDKNTGNTVAQSMNTEQTDTINDAIIDNIYTLSHGEISESTTSNGEKGERGEKGEPGKDCTPLNPVTIALIVSVLLVIVFIIAYGIYMHKRLSLLIKNNYTSIANS